MKKTLTVNLGGTVYHIDDDAYRLLDDYLANLKHFFRKQEGAYCRAVCRESVRREASHYYCRCGRNNCPGRQTGRFWCI